MTTLVAFSLPRAIRPGSVAINTTGTETEPALGMLFPAAISCKTSRWGQQGARPITGSPRSTGSVTHMTQQATLPATASTPINTTAKAGLLKWILGPLVKPTISTTSITGG